LTQIIQRDDPTAPAGDMDAWADAASNALSLAAPGAHPFLVALLAIRIANMRARDGQQAARRFQNYCATMLRRTTS